MRRVRLGRLAIGTQGGVLTWVMAAVLLSAGSAAVAQEEATATEASCGGPAAGGHGHGDAPRGEPEQGADQRDGAHPGKHG